LQHAWLLSYNIAAKYRHAYGRYAYVHASRGHASHPAHDNQLLQKTHHCMLLKQAAAVLLWSVLVKPGQPGIMLGFSLN